MLRGNLDDLAAFAEVASERSFTRAAAKLGISSSALSQTMKNLEERLGLRLLNRTTRSVTTTESGEKLLSTFLPMLRTMQSQFEALRGENDAPEGTIRLTTTESAVESILWPRIRQVLTDFPKINIEIDVDARLINLVADGYDAGVRLAGSIDKDMISFPISDEMPVCIIGSPSYFSQYGYPNSVSELSHHRCINLRLPTSGGNYAWELRENNCDMKVKVSGQCVFNTIKNVKQACLDGLGLAYIPKLHVQHELDTGELEQIMSEFTPPFPAFHIYYPSRRQQSMAFEILLNALKKE